MGAPVVNYVNSNGSLFRIYDQAFDLELVTGFSGISPARSGSLSPSYFNIILEGKTISITNQFAINRLNKQDYLFPGSSAYEYYFDVVSASLDLYNEFHNRYCAFIEHITNIKGYLNETSSVCSSDFFPS